MYQLMPGGVLRFSDGAFIPSNPLNADWIAFLGWLAEGNTALPYVQPVVSQDDIDAAVINTYTKLIALKTMTPAEVIAWVQANVTTLAAAQDAIATLAIAVGFLARRI